MGVERYNMEQMEKARQLETLLENYNDGRKKTLFCQAVNLLSLQDIKDVMKALEKKDMRQSSLIEAVRARIGG